MQLNYETLQLKPNEDQSETADNPSAMSTEFKTPEDLKDSGQFPVRDEDGEAYIPFFKFTWLYPIGPCVFRMCKY
jgi:hypothetical protein